MTDHTQARRALSISLHPPVMHAVANERERIARATGIRPSLNAVINKVLASALPPPA